MARSLQFTGRTLADIEHGVRKARPGTYAMLENKLAWAPGSIDTILAGGEPRETMTELRPPASVPAPHPSSNALSRASTEELLLELRRRTVAPAKNATTRQMSTLEPEPLLTHAQTTSANVV